MLPGMVVKGRETQMLAVRIDKGLHSGLKAIAERERRTMTVQLEIALEQHLEREAQADLQGTPTT